MQNPPAAPFAQRYEEALRQHLRRRPRGVQTSRAGRALGREAATLGLDAVALSRLHDQAVSVIAPTQATSSAPRAGGKLSPLGVFFLEVLGPIERARQTLRPDRRSRRCQHSRDRVYQILLAEDAERVEFGRKLREEILQTLAGTHLHLSALSAEGDASEHRQRTTIARTQQLLNLSMSALLHLARRLHPAILDNLGLVPALRALVVERSERQLTIHLAAAEEAEGLTPSQRTVLYRVVEEALTLVARHARATLVKVSLISTVRSVVLKIRDDGQTFASSTLLDAEGLTGLGLEGMRERVEMVGGRFSLESTSGKTKVVRAEMPFSPPPSPFAS